MRSLGDSTYFLKATYEPLKELMGDKDYIFIKDPINGYVIHTDRIDDELLENVNDLLNDEFRNKFRKTHYNHNMEISWRDINKYANCTTVSEINAVNQDYMNDLTSDSEWVYPLINLKSVDSLFSGGWKYYKKINLFLPNATNCHWILAWATCDDITLDLPKITTTNQIFRDVTVGIFRVKIPKTLTDITSMIEGWGVREIYGNFEHVEKANGSFQRLNTRMLRILDSDWSSLSSGSSMFASSIIHKDVALRVLTTIPSYSSGSHPITLGIHVDYKTDEELINAIANAEAKGWTLTVQWNGTPTAQTTSTFGLRKPSIYAKLSEIERPDGSKEQIIDWGHYVSNPEDYEEFSSLEDAYEHFGLPNNTEN